MMRKIAYIIPAYSENVKSRRYKIIFDYFRSIGVTTYPIRIRWRGNRKTPTDYKNEFLAQYNKIKRKGDRVYLFGYSLGAHIAFVSSVRIKPKFIVLCSLPPWFSENIPNLPKKWMKWHSRWILDYEQISFRKLAKKINVEVLLFVGSKEPKLYLDQTKLAEKALKNCKVVVVRGGKHAMGQITYQNALKNTLMKRKYV